MNKLTPLPPAPESERHYTTPEGFFDQLEERILAKLPEEDASDAHAEDEAYAKPTLWVRLRPILYLAAMFVSMSLLFRAFQESPVPAETTASAEATTPEPAYDDYLVDYGERMLAGQAYSTYYQDLAGEPQATFTSYE